MATVSPCSNCLPATPSAICTPSVLYGNLSPWAQQTPWPSPFLSDRQPSFCLEDSDGLYLAGGTVPSGSTAHSSSTAPSGSTTQSNCTDPSGGGVSCGGGIPMPPSAVACPPLPLRSRCAGSQSSEQPAAAQKVQGDETRRSLSSSNGVASPKTLPDVQTLLSKDFLRKVCAPLFEEMVDAVQQALQAKVDASTVQGQCMTQQQCLIDAIHAHIGLASAVKSPTGHSTPKALPSGRAALSSSEDSGTESFSVPSLTSSSDLEGAQCSSLTPTPTPTPSEIVAEEMSRSEPQQAMERSEAKRCTMVCHHWKSKGWCRMGDNCKFMHPENKRGVGNASSASSCACKGKKAPASSGSDGKKIATPICLPAWFGQQSPLPTMASMAYPMPGCPQAALWVFQPSR